MESNSVNNLERTQGTFLPSLVHIGLAVWEKMFKEIDDDTRGTADTGLPQKLPLNTTCSGELELTKRKYSNLKETSSQFF